MLRVGEHFLYEIVQGMIIVPVEKIVISMRRIFNTSTNNNSLHFWLLILRIAVACLMLTHGWPKMEKILAGNMQFADPLGIGTTPSLVLVVFAEVICSILILIGLATRLATIPLIINMAIVAFVVHAQDPFGKKELPLLFLLIYITLLVLGPGKYSVDGMIGRGSRYK
jgi:putative oxidoreductase